MIKHSPFSFFIILICASFPAHAEKLSKHITTIVQPKPIVRVHPKYPKNAARNKREGWAKLSFIIEKDGSVSNVLVDETSGSQDFANESIRAISKWKYKPAFENGEPIQQCVNSVQMDFKMSKEHKNNAVTRWFRSKYNKASESLKNKDYDNVQLLLEQMTEMKNRHLSENNYLHLLSSYYANAIGDLDKELFHLNRVTLQLLPEDQQLSILDSKLMIQLKKNLLRSANSTYLTLSKLSSAQPYIERYNQLIDKVDEIISGDKNLIVSGKIYNKDYWSYALVRNEFSLVDIKGALNKLDVRCANKRHVYTVEKNNTWTIPKAWKNCNIYVYGDNDTQFTLVEHPLSKKA